MQLMKWTTLAMILAGLVMPTWSHAKDDSRDLMNFSDPAETAKYVVGQGVSFSIQKEAGSSFVEITVDPFEKHGNKWPTFTMSVNAFGKPLDLTHFSHIEVDYEKVTEGLVTFSTTMCTLPYNDRGTNMEYFAVTVPGGTALTQSIDLLEIRKPYNDPSNLQCIQLLLPVTAKVERYRVRAFRAVKKPGAETIGDVIQRKADDLQKEIAVLRESKTDGVDTLTDELAPLQKEIHRGMRDGFRGTYRSLSTRIDALAQRVHQQFLASIKEDLYLWEYPQARVLAEGVTPTPISTPVDHLSIGLAQGTLQSATFMVSATKTAIDLEIELELPPELAGRCELFYTDYYRIFSQNFTLGDLIIPVGESPLKLAGGESRELRLRVNSNGLTAGKYTFAVKLRNNATGTTVNLPGEVSIWPFELVNYDQMDNYCYAIFGASTPAEVERHRAALALMKQYGLNVVEVPPHFIDDVTLDESGNVISMNTAGMQYSIKGLTELWNELPGDQRIKFQLFVHVNRNIPDDHPNRQQAYVQWIGKVIEAMRSFGLQDDQFCFAMSDEASLARLENVDIPLALAVKERWPEVLLFTNSSQVFDDPAAAQRYADAFDIFAPEGNSIRNNKFLREFILGIDKAKSLYKCDFMGGPNADYYGYYRLFAWEGFRMGIYSLGLWIFNAHENTETFYTAQQATTNVGYSLANRIKGGTVVGTRRFEIYHQGLTDMRYLLTLKSLDDSAETDAFISEAVTNVLANPHDQSRAEMQRERIAQKIMELKK